jgi:hypothetical protein
MFYFSANNLVMLSRRECKFGVVFVMKDQDTQRIYRLYDFGRSQQIVSDHVYCASGFVNSADRIYLVLTAANTDKKHDSHLIAPVDAHRAGG